MEDKKYQEIEISKIIIPEKRARATLTEQQIEELKENIKKHGFTIPILVKTTPDGNYELIDGQHRIEIVKEFGWERVPAVIISADEKRAAILNITSNTLRGTQDCLTISEALNEAAAKGATLEELAAAWGKSEITTKLYLSLVKLPEVYRNALRDQKLYIGHIKEALRLPTPEDQDYFLGLCIKLGWNLNTAKTYVDRRINEIKLAQKRAEALKEPPKIPEPDADKLLSYDECFYCRRRVPKGSVFMNLLCIDCKSLLSWILENLGDPVSAMEYCYKALQRQLEFDKYQELKKKFEEEEKQKSSQDFENHKPPLPSEFEEKSDSQATGFTET